MTILSRRLLSAGALAFAFLPATALFAADNPKEIYVDWATYNPVSYLLESIRSLVITGWDAQALALGFGFAAVLLVVSLAFSQSAMRSRLARR